MQHAVDLAESTVSETGVVIPAEALREAGIHPGDRVAFVRTARGSLLVLPTKPPASEPSLRSVIGIAPRPEDMQPADDRMFLEDIRRGDERL